MIVAILLHVLIVLQRRHRRLKRELQQTQKSGLGRDTANQQSPLWLHQQAPGVQQHTSLAILNGARILAHFDVHGVPGESGGGQPTQLGLQQVQYTETSGGPYPPTSQSVFQKQEPMKGSGCTAFCLWCRRKSYNPKTYDAAFYDEIIQRNSAVVPPEHTTSILQNCSPLPETSKSSLESNAYTPFLGSKNSTGFYSSGKNVDDSAILTTSSPGPCTSADPDNRTKLISQTAPTYAPGSSMSGGSANNQSTAESSLPTQSSSGWTEPRGVFLPCGNNSAASAAIKNPTLGTERPSISGSSETGGFLIGSDFDMRRANVALPPAMPPPPPLPPLVSGPIPAQVVGSIPPDSSPKPLGLASFRCANPQDSCALVAPYAQLQLSLSLDQYDTPEEIFRAEGSDSSCSYAQHASSNPTTNSSLLQSYCEHGGGDYKS
nr:unnamed protein product [Spirometra erinaceieuropaei]